MSRPACLLCGEPTRADGAQHFRRTTAWRRCDRCDFAQVDPLPEPAELAEYYGSGAYRREVLDSTNRAQVSADAVTLQDRNGVKRRVAHWLPHIRDAERHLDVGSAWGGTLLRVALERRIGESVGVEPGPWGRRYGALESIEQAEGPFDLVTCFHVLEHVTDPLGFLRGISRLASGQVCMGVPLPGSRYWPHLSEFSVGSLLQAMGRAGLPAKLVGMGPELMALHDKEIHS